MAVLAMQEFEDVVLLRQVHRSRVAGASREGDAVLKTMTAEERRRYEAEGQRFMEVAHRLSTLSWTLEDHAWFSQR